MRSHSSTKMEAIEDYDDEIGKSLIGSDYF